MKLKNQNKNQPSFEEYYYLNLLKKFIQDFPKARFLNKTVEFHLVYQWFSFHRIEKLETRKIIKEWIKRGYCKSARYHGIKFNCMIK